VPRGGTAEKSRQFYLSFNGSDYRMITQTVTKADKLDLKLAPGGGWAAVISPKSR
jgi:hypothetical protein